MNYIKQVKEFLKDPKKKALTQLGIYAVFFIFVFILLSMNGNNTKVNPIEEEKTPLEAYEQMKGYNYKVTYTSIEKTDTIEGTYYDNKSLFNYNGFKYYYEDNLYVIDNDSYYLSNIEYNVSKMFNNNLINIINELEELSKTTYKDGKIEINYTIDSNKIYNYLFELESSYDNLVNVSIVEIDNKIQNIVLDLSNLGLNLIKIEISYENIDEIENLNFNKDNYNYKESLW